jgi:DNA-directed RNA polymerase specialized sigma24 family protein
LTHSVFIQNNWTFIKKWSKIWGHENWNDLVVNLTLYLDKDWKKFSLLKTDDEKIKWIQAWMRNQTKWSNTQFNKDIRLISGSEEWDFSSEGVDSNSIEIGAEEADERVKDWIIDLNRRHSDLDCTRLIKIRKIYLTLPSHEKVLYKLYFEEMKSLRDIAAQLRLPLSAVHNMMLELKNKIKDGLDN